jgi:hypothetical protein
MNFESLAMEKQANVITGPQDGVAADQESDITPMSTESFSLVGGGSAIVLLG